MHNVLLIEDNPGDARLIREMISEDERAPFTVHAADRLAKADQAARIAEVGGEDAILKRGTFRYSPPPLN
jgi:hypothetical protein